MVDTVGGKVVITSVADDTGIKKTQEGLKATEKQAQSTNTALVAGSKAAQKEIRKASVQAEGETKAAFNRRRLAEEQAASSSRKISLAGSVQVVADQRRTLQALQKEQRESGQKILQEKQRTSDQEVEIEKQKTRKVTETVKRAASNRSAVRKIEISEVEKQLAIEADQRKRSPSVRAAAFNKAIQEREARTVAEKAAAAPPGGQAPPPGGPPPPPPPPGGGGDEPPNKPRRPRRWTESDIERYEKAQGWKSSTLDRFGRESVKRGRIKEEKITTEELKAIQRASNEELADIARKGASQERAVQKEQHKRARSERSQELRELADSERQSRILRAEGIRHFAIYAHMMGYRLPRIQFLVPAFELFYRRFGSLSGIMGNATKSTLSWIGVGQNAIATVLKMGTGAGFAVAGFAGLGYAMTKAAAATKDWDVSQLRLGMTLRNTTMAGREGIEGLEKRTRDLSRTLGVPIAEAREAITNLFEARIDPSQMDRAQKDLQKFIARTGMEAVEASKLWRGAMNNNVQAATNAAEAIRGELDPITKLRFEIAGKSILPGPLREAFLREIERNIPEDAVEQLQKVEGALGRHTRAWNQSKTAMTDFGREFGRVSKDIMEPLLENNAKGIVNITSLIGAATQKLRDFDNYMNSRAPTPGPFPPTGMVPNQYYGMKAGMRGDTTSNFPQSSRPMRKEEKDLYTRGVVPEAVVPQTPSLLQQWRKSSQERINSPEYKAEQKRGEDYYNRSVNRSLSSGLTGNRRRKATTALEWILESFSNDPIAPVRRQSGGHLAKYQPAIVGEHGPERFVPSMSGIVYPFQGQSSQTGPQSPLQSQAAFSMLRRFAGELSAATGSVQTFGNTVEVVAMRMNSILSSLGKTQGGASGGEGFSGGGRGGGGGGGWGGEEDGGRGSGEGRGGGGGGGWDRETAPGFQPPKDLGGAGPFTPPPRLKGSSGEGRGGGGGGGWGDSVPPPGEAGQYRPVYKASAADLDQRVINTIAGEVSTKNQRGVDAVINNMFNRLGTKGYGPSGNLLQVARARGQYAGYRPAKSAESEMIRDRIRAIASGSVPDITKGSNEYRASYYVYGEGYNRKWARTLGRPYGTNIGGNIFARNPKVGESPYAAYPNPRNVETAQRSVAPPINTERAVPIPQPKTAAVPSGKDETTQLGRGAVDINLTLPPYLMASKPTIRQPERFNVSMTVNRDTTGRPKGLSRPGDPSIPVGGV